MIRSRGYYRKQRERAINRKFAIQEVRMGKQEAHKFYRTFPKGALSKGKVHCSCPMCRTKSYDNLSHRDTKLKVMSDLELDFERY